MAWRLPIDEDALRRRRRTAAVGCPHAPTARRRRPRNRLALRWVLRVVCAGSFLGAAIVVTGTPGDLVPHPVPAFADGPVPCGPTTRPAYPYAGFCGDYDGDVTWYGTYGPGFPTAQGFGLCADSPASGGAFPAPSYDYAPGGAPTGAHGDWNALGFAFSQGQAEGWWNGVTGQFTADQAAAAAKLLYDTVVWGTPVPAMDPGVLAAYDAFDNWFNQAVGMAGAPPQLFVGLTSAASSFTGSATDDIHLQFPGTGHPVVGEPLLVTITNGTFDSPTGPTTVGVATDANGNVLVPVYATNASPVTVTVTATAGVGQPGLGFLHPTAGDAAAQVLAAFAAPTVLQASQSLTSTGQPQAQFGTLSVQKAGDDTAYYGLAGAVFQVLQGATVVATLVTDASGGTLSSPQLPTGTYTVHEATPPPGYRPAPDQTVAVQAFQNTVVAYTGADEDHIVPAGLTLAKVDAQSGAPLAGAVLEVRYSSAADGVYDQDLGTCTTGPSGTCAPAGNDGTALLPGDYQVTEVAAPPGYDLDPATSVQDVTLAPGEQGTVTFSDFLLGSLQVRKSGDDTAYEPVAGATFTVAGPAPSAAPVGTLTVGADGSSNVLGGLVPGTYTLTETSPPPGYAAAAPVPVAVADGHATTVVDVADRVVPATVSLLKVDALTNAPLAGAVFDVRYSTAADGVYDQDLGTCSTGSSGTCTPAGNDGAALLPGDYQVTEVSPPPGYALDPATSTRELTLSPGQAGSLTFADPRLVAASFHKVAAGNINPAEVTLAGAVVQVVDGSGAPVATCTTDASGTCTTAAVLLAGSAYCWSETSAPPGLVAGAHGCFTATDGESSQPVTVTDPGTFVAVAARKVDAADPSVTLAGATFDLYRVDGGHGPGSVPEPPADAASAPGETWVARATTDDQGLASFPLQFPGYAYCLVEHQAPPDYVADPSPHCTPVLAGSASAPPAVTTITVADTEATVTLGAHKYNSVVPATVIPGATYDLYVEGPPPPSGVPLPAPGDARAEPGDTWYARGTTDAAGNLSFTVPAGYAWCLLEHQAPPDYVADPALHCTAVLTTGSPPGASVLALPETLATVHLSARKYDSLQPGTVIPGATYELLVQGAPPPGSRPPAPPPGTPVPPGDVYWGQGTSGPGGILTFAVPAGSSWCLHELGAPAGYRPDPAYHCTAVVTADTPAAAASIALPELPLPLPLAFTGAPSLWLACGALLLLAGGGALRIVGERRDDAQRRLRRQRPAAGGRERQ